MNYTFYELALVRYDTRSEGKAAVYRWEQAIYVWTVNTEENINNMIDLNVDNIITDDITLARQSFNISQLLPIFCEPQNRIKPVGIRPSTTKDGFSSGS